jgi:hypothetical protein
MTPTPQLLRLAKEVRIGGASVYAGTIVTVNPGTVVTVSEMVRTAKAKQPLPSTMVEHPIACVDMEFWPVARFCASHQIPFLIVRPISDAFDEDLPRDFNRYRRVDGNLDLPKIGGSILMHPWSVGGLLNLCHHAWLCTRRLAQFVEQMTSGDSGFGD